MFFFSVGLYCIFFVSFSLGICDASYTAKLEHVLESLRCDSTAKCIFIYIVKMAKYIPTMLPTADQRVFSDRSPSV